MRVVLWLLLGGCSSPCMGCPEGGPVDLEAAAVEVRAVFEGGFEGVAADDPGQERGGVHFEACALDGASFTLDLAVGEAERCRRWTRRDGYAPAACTQAHTGSFPLDGTLEPGGEVAGSLSLVVWREGLAWEGEGSLEPPAGPFPHQTLDLVVAGTPYLDDLVFTGLSWGRRLSEDDATLTVWEVCALDVGA